MIKITRKSSQPIKKLLSFSENLILLLSNQIFCFICRVYSAADSHCLIPINLPFNGDLTVHLTHAAIGHSRQTHVNLHFVIENLSQKKKAFCSRREEFVYVN